MPRRRTFLLHQRLVEQSNRIGGIRLAVSPALRSSVSELGPALASASPARVQPVVQRIADEVCRALRVPRVLVTVELARPHNRSGELHGLYTSSRDAGAHIRLWVLTAKRQQVAAFKTFLRTLLHELCHHLDYTLLRLGGSVHCEGFYKRESSLFRQLTAHLESTTPVLPAPPH